MSRARPSPSRPGERRNAANGSVIRSSPIVKRYIAAAGLPLVGPEAAGAYDPRRKGVVEIKKAMGAIKYVKPTHQPKFTARIEVDRARERTVSFDRLVRKVESAVRLLTGDGTTP